jgi:hypothetical protein
MASGRRFGGWATVGALAGYFVSFFWLLFLVMWPDGIPGDWEIASILFVLFFVPVLYTCTGLCVVGIALGVGCGLACAWLPKWLRLWQRQAIFTTLILLTGPVSFLIMPHWPCSFTLS